MTVTWQLVCISVLLVLAAGAARAAESDTPGVLPDTGALADVLLDTPRLTYVFDTTALVRAALLCCDDSGTTWLLLPSQQASRRQGLLDLDARVLGRNRDAAQATASRTVNTIAEVAEDYRFDRFANWMRSINESQSTTYQYLDRWHEEYIENYNLDVRRTHDSITGDYLYVFGYKADF